MNKCWDICQIYKRSFFSKAPWKIIVKYWKEVCRQMKELFCFSLPESLFEQTTDSLKFFWQKQNWVCVARTERDLNKKTF